MLSEEAPILSTPSGSQNYGCKANNWPICFPFSKSFANNFKKNFINNSPFFPLVFIKTLLTLLFSIPQS